MSLTSRYAALRDQSLLWRSGADASPGIYGEVDSWDGFSWAADWFDDLALVTPHQVAIEIPAHHETATYAELSTLSHEAALWLSSLGVIAGDVVRLAARESLNLWVLLLALDRMGAVIVQVQPNLSASEGRRRTPMAIPLFELDERVLLGPDGTAHPLPQWTGESRHIQPARLPASSPMWGYYTSGTTSAPKLVIHNRVSYSVGHLSSVAFHDLQPGSRHTNLSGPGWAKFAWSAYYVPFASAATYISLSEVGAAHVPDWLRDYHVQTVCASPTRWKQVAAHTTDRFPLQQAYAAGEPLPDDTARNVKEITGRTPRSVFGMTEVTAALGERRAGHGMDPLPGYEVRAPIEGENRPLEIRPGISLMNGYASTGIQPAARRTTTAHWFRTGDAVTVHDCGHYTVIGRLDDLINIDGHLWSPAELEREVESSIGSGRAMVFQDHRTGDIVA